MKKIALLFGLSTALFGCFKIEKADISNIKDELKMTKPMKITDGDLMAIAEQIGDSLVLGLSVKSDTNFAFGEHLVKVQSSTATMTPKEKQFFEAYAYSLEQSQEIQPNVKKPKKSDHVDYHSAKLSPDSTLHLISIQIHVKDIMVRVADRRKALHEARKLENQQQKEQ